MNVPHTAATVSLELRGGPGLTVESAPQGARSWMFAGAAFVSGLVYLLRKSYTDGVRRRVIRRLDAIAPRTRYVSDKLRNGVIFNADCPVCLCEFAQMGDKAIRVLECGHALCADCLEAWAVHCTKAHLNPSRFGITRGGRVVAWTPGPKCPLCCAQLNCVPREDLREAVIAAISERGVALSTFMAYQSRVVADAHVSPFRDAASAAGSHGGGGERDGARVDEQEEEDERAMDVVHSQDADGHPQHRPGDIDEVGQGAVQEVWSNAGGSATVW